MKIHASSLFGLETYQKISKSQAVILVILKFIQPLPEMFAILLAKIRDWYIYQVIVV